jgi:hypothetical protein
MTTRTRLLGLGLGTLVSLVAWCSESAAGWCCRGHGGSGGYGAFRGDGDDAIKCPPGYVPVKCMDVWTKVDDPKDAEGCVLPEYVGKECRPRFGGPMLMAAAGACKEPVFPVVCDRCTHCWRKARCCERPHGFLPAKYIGAPCPACQ